MIYVSASCCSFYVTPTHPVDHSSHLHKPTDMINMKNATDETARYVKAVLNASRFKEKKKA